MANIIGIGIDICEILRVKRLYEKYNHSFLKKILTEKEIQDFLKHQNNYQRKNQKKSHLCWYLIAGGQ